MSSPTSVSHREKFDAFVRERQEALTLPWIGATVAIGACSIILSFVGESGPVERPAVVHYVCFGLALGFAVASIALPRRALSDAQIAAQMRREPEPHALSAALGLDHDHYHFLLGIPKLEQRQATLIRLFRDAYVLGLGMSSGVALTGFAYGIATKSVMAAAPYFSVAFALNGWHYPRLAPLMERGRKLDRPDAVLVELGRTLDKMKDDMAPQPKEAPQPKRAARTSNRPPPRATKP